MALSRFVRVAKAGWELRVGPLRELVDVVEPVLPPDCEADAALEGAERRRCGAVPGRSVVVTTGGATGLGAGVAGARGVVTGGGVVTVTGGVLTVTGGGDGAGGSAVVTGSGGGGGAGGSAVVTGQRRRGRHRRRDRQRRRRDGHPGDGRQIQGERVRSHEAGEGRNQAAETPEAGHSEATTCDPRKRVRAELAMQACSSSSTGFAAGTGSCGWSWPCSSSCE